MGIAVEKYETIRTLYELGNSIRMIATVTGISKSVLGREIRDIVEDYNPKGVKQLSTSLYVTSSLIALSIESDSDKSKITALNSVKVDTGDVETVTTTTKTHQVRDEILEILNEDS